jgi:sortase (surface protein transpeptidase)
MFFILKYIKIIYIFLKLFLISVHKNDLKTPKSINLKQKNKKISNNFKNSFKKQKQTGPSRKKKSEMMVRGFFF